MADENKTKLRLTTVVYWVLLMYIIAALVWWAVLLVQEAQSISALQKENLSYRIKDSTSQEYQSELYQIEDKKRRSIYKYFGEGAMFLLLIIIGAVYIYRAVRRQFRLHQQQQNFVMAITHELKTPIAVSRLNLETLQKYKLDEAKKEKLLQMTLQETFRLDSLINNILISSQLEDNNYRVTREEISFSDLVKDVAHHFSNRYPERKLISHIDEDIEMNGDPVLMKLLVSNLLENAQKYSPMDKPIYLNLTATGKIRLEIIDEGPGIPASEKDNIFKKFYRLGTEQTRKSQGTGLGLYLSRKITKDHDGEIFVKQNQPTGSKFIVQFPLT